MAGGRPPMGPKLVERIEGSKEAKEKLEVILETLSGRLTIQEACASLRLSESRFHELRWQMLDGAVESLEPRPMGRPRQVVPDPRAELEALKREMKELRWKLKALEVSEEIAAAMPELAKRGLEKKANPGRKK